MRFATLRLLRPAASAAGEIGIAGRQRPDGMQMFGQDHDGIDRERTLLPRDAERTVPNVSFGPSLLLALERLPF